MTVKLTRIEGPAVILECVTCPNTGVGGTDTYASAATGETRTPELWYREEIEDRVHCSTCAAKLTEEDPTRAISQFYSDTAGNEVLPENLPG